MVQINRTPWPGCYEFIHCQDEECCGQLFQKVYLLISNQARALGEFVAERLRKLVRIFVWTRWGDYERGRNSKLWIFSHVKPLMAWLANCSMSDAFTCPGWASPNSQTHTLSFLFCINHGKAQHTCCQCSCILISRLYGVGGGKGGDCSF